jgi:DNA-binding winged helix-turn-helix (wHTH) protein
VPPPGGALESLAAVAAQLAAPLPRDRMAAAVAEAAAQTLDAPPIVIALRDDRHPRLRPVHSSGPSQNGRHHRGVAVLPIPPRGPRIGVMFVGRRLTKDELAFLGVLSALFGLALERLRLSEWRRRVGDLEIDVGEQRVFAGDREVHLTPSEIRMLLFLAEEPGRPRTRREILQHLWHTDDVGDERACDAHVANLRRKIERDPSHPQRLVTVRSVGYALRSDVKVPSHLR